MTHSPTTYYYQLEYDPICADTYAMMSFASNVYDKDVGDNLVSFKTLFEPNQPCRVQFCLSQPLSDFSGDYFSCRALTEDEILTYAEDARESSLVSIAETTIDMMIPEGVNVEDISPLTRYKLGKIFTHVIDPLLEFGQLHPQDVIDDPFTSGIATRIRLANWGNRKPKIADAVVRHIRTLLMFGNNNWENGKSRIYDFLLITNIPMTIDMMSDITDYPHDEVAFVLNNSPLYVQNSAGCYTLNLETEDLQLKAKNRKDHLIDQHHYMKRLTDIFECYRQTGERHYGTY